MKAKKLAETGYQLLMIATCLDGAYAPAKGKKLIKWLNLRITTDDMDALNLLIKAVPSHMIPYFVEILTRQFLILSTEDERIRFVETFYEVMLADGGVLDSDEVNIFHAVAKTLEVDVSPMMQSVF